MRATRASAEGSTAGGVQNVTGDGYDGTGEWEHAGATATTGSGGTTSTTSSVRIVVGALAAVVVLGIVAAAAVLSGSFGSVEDAAAGLVPADAPVYVSAYVDPSGAQKIALRDLLARFPVDEDAGDDPVDAIGRALDTQLSQVGLSYDEDIRPWLGHQVAFFLLAPEGGGPDQEGAALVATTDADATKAAVVKLLEAEGLAGETSQRSRAGVTYELVAAEQEEAVAYGVVEDFFVVGTEAGMQAAVDAAGGGALADAEAFQDAVADLPDDHLLRYYVDSAGLYTGLSSELTARETEMLDRLGMADQNPTAGVLLAREDGLVFEASATVAEDGPGRDIARSFEGTAALERLPGGAWLALAVPDLGDLVGGYRDMFSVMADVEAGMEDLEAEFARETGMDLQDDVLSWMGSAGMFVRGRDLLSIRGGLVVDSTDSEASRAFVTDTEQLLTRYGVATSGTDIAGLSGFVVQPPGMPVEAVLVAGSGDGGEQVVLAVGREAARDAIAVEQPLADAEGFQAASEALDGHQPVFYLDLATVTGLIEDAIGGFAGGLPPEYREEVKPHVDRLATLVAGVSVDGDHISQRVVLTVRDRDGGA